MAITMITATIVTMNFDLALIISTPQMIVALKKRPTAHTGTPTQNDKMNSSGGIYGRLNVENCGWNVVPLPIIVKSRWQSETPLCMVHCVALVLTKSTQIILLTLTCRKSKVRRVISSDRLHSPEARAIQ